MLKWHSAKWNDEAQGWCDVKNFLGLYVLRIEIFRFLKKVLQFDCKKRMIYLWGHFIIKCDSLIYRWHQYTSHKKLNSFKKAVNILLCFVKSEIIKGYLVVKFNGAVSLKELRTCFLKMLQQWLRLTINN